MNLDARQGLNIVNCMFKLNLTIFSVWVSLVIYLSGTENGAIMVREICTCNRVNDYGIAFINFYKVIHTLQNMTF